MVTHPPYPYRFCSAVAAATTHRQPRPLAAGTPVCPPLQMLTFRSGQFSGRMCVCTSMRSGAPAAPVAAAVAEDAAAGAALAVDAHAWLQHPQPELSAGAGAVASAALISFARDVVLPRRGRSGFLVPVFNPLTVPRAACRAGLADFVTTGRNALRFRSLHGATHEAPTLAASGLGEYGTLALALV